MTEFLMEHSNNKGAPAGGMIKNIQAMRGVASLVVFVGHALLLQPGIGLDQFFSFFGVIASSGVDIFFVISGFIITTVAMKSGDEGHARGRCAWNFGVKRITRIYPIYWLVFLCVCLLSPWVNFAPPVTDIKPVAQQFFLLTHVNSHIMAAWSLAFEVYFYAVIVVALLISPRNVGKILTLWAISVTGVISYDYFIGHNGWIGMLPFSPLILEFIMGMAVAYVIWRGFTEFAVTAAFLGIVSFVAGLEVMRQLGWSTLNPWYRTFYSGIPSTLIIYAVVALEYRRVWTFSDFWVKLGDASYSLYIWHQFIFYSILTLVMHKAWAGHVPAVVLISLWTLPALVFGIYSYKFLEMPIQRSMNRALLLGEQAESKGWRSKRLGYVAALIALVAVIGGYSYATSLRSRAVAQEGAELGAKVSASMASAGDKLERAAVGLGLRQDADIRGHLDGVYREPGFVRVHGWAADVSRGEEGVKMLVFYCGKYIGVAPRDRRRPDVAASLGIAEMNTGFTVNLPAGDECQDRVVEGLLVGEAGGFAVVTASISGS